MPNVLGSLLRIQFAGATDTGKYRQHNEDAFLCLPEYLAAVVADGMGGLSRGEVASRMVVDAMVESLHAGDNVQQGLLLAHRRIREASMAPRQERMGSTAVAVKIDDDTATIFWVGDSRAYLLREQQLIPLTRDHSLVNDLIDAGAISAAAAESHPNRHVLTRAIGIREVADIEIDCVTHGLKAGDRLLLCSDGLHGFLDEAKLAQCLGQEEDAEAIVRELVQATLQETQADDNITALCIVVKG